MRKLGSVILLIIMVLSVIPAIASDFQPLEDGDEEEDITVNVSGTRGTIKNESVTFTSGGSTVSGHLYYEATKTGLPTVVFGVGYTAQITDLFDSSNYGWLAEDLAVKGYAILVVRYWANYENPMELLNLSGDYSLWVNQTRDAVTALKTNAITGATVNTQALVDPARIALGGHSIGGAVSIVSGAQDRRIKAVFVLSPQNYAGMPRMNNFIDEMSPVPIQLQVGELDLFGGVATVQQSYNAASQPREMVSYRYGTYEGFTDLGSFENIDIDDDYIPDLLKPILQSNPVSTKQQDMSKNYTSAFLDYYLKNTEGFAFKEDLSIPYVYYNPPLPPVEYPDIWHATVTHQGLDTIFHHASTSPGTLDFANGDSITIRARITPKGIWEQGVKATLIFPEGGEESYDMEFNDDYDISAGYFYVTVLDIPISHTLGTVRVNITAKDYDDLVHTYDLLTFVIMTSSGSPVIEDISTSPDPIVPDATITFTFTTSDPEGDAIAYYSIDFGDGSTSGWVGSNDITHVFAESGQYILRAYVKDDKAAESEEELITTVASNPPVAELDVDSSVKEGNELELDASGSSDEDGDSLDYFFTFGDGVETGWVDSPKAYHRYDETGEVTVSVKVMDEWGRESTVVEAAVTVKENSGDSPLSSVTSSSGFPLIILIVVMIIILGGFFLLRGEEDEDELKEGAGPDGKPSPDAPTGKGPGKKLGEGIPVARSVRKKGEEGKPVPGPEGRRKRPPAGEGRAEEKLPRPVSSTRSRERMDDRKAPRQVDGAPPVLFQDKQPQREQPQREQPQREQPQREQPQREQPQREQPQREQPQEEPDGEPEIDAPPIEEENWDDLDDEEETYDGEGDDSEGSGEDDSEEYGGDVWEDEDFAIPVALKEKLKKESQ